jgi:hypothetical protein
LNWKLQWIIIPPQHGDRTNNGTPAGQNKNQPSQVNSSKAGSHDTEPRKGDDHLGRMLATHMLVYHKLKYK